MEPLADLNALRPILNSLKQKGLVVSLTPEGRGHVVSHALYQPREMEKLQSQFAGQGTAAEATAPAHEPRTPSVAHTPAAAPASAPVAQAASGHQQEIDALRRELEVVRAEVARLRKDLDDLWSQFR